MFNFYLWKFVLIYMNDVIIYFKNSTKHFVYFKKMLCLLKNFEMTLFLSKCHFAYSNIKVLNHWINRFKFNIFEKKIEIIRKLIFFKILKKLKIAFDFFEYYRKFVTWYIFIEKFLQQLKMQKFKNNSIKKNTF